MERIEMGELRFLAASAGVPFDPKTLRVLLFLLHWLWKLCIPTNLSVAGLVKRVGEWDADRVNETLLDRVGR